VTKLAKILIDPKYCKGCELCIAVCPKKTIERGHSLTTYGTLYPVQAHPENCMACKMCGVICPEAAIEVYKGEE